MKTVLFVDDNRNIREFCRRQLEAEGYRVVVAANGGEAIRAVRKETPDALILDLCTPAMGGLEAIEQIREFAPSVPVVFFTANDADCLTNRRSRLATACVEKSEDLARLKQAILRASMSVHRRSGLRLRCRGMMRADLRDILRIEADVFAHPWSEQDFMQHLHDPTSVALLLEGDNDIAGYVVFGFHRPWLKLFSCVVQRGYQRQGIGWTMIARLVEIVNMPEWRGILLKVPERKVGEQLFFRHCGFRAVRTLPAYLLDGQNVHVMEYAVHQSSNQDGLGMWEDNELIPLWEMKHG